jgi:hypothetical protein
MVLSSSLPWSPEFANARPPALANSRDRCGDCALLLQNVYHLIGETTKSFSRLWKTFLILSNVFIYIHKNMKNSRHSWQFLHWVGKIAKLVGANGLCSGSLICGKEKRLVAQPGARRRGVGKKPFEGDGGRMPQTFAPERIGGSRYGTIISCECSLSTVSASK